MTPINSNLLQGPKKWLGNIRSFSLKSRSALLGLDVGHRNIKGIRLTGRSGRVALESFFCQDLSQIFQNFPSGRDLNQVLKALSEIHQLSGVVTSSAIPDSQMIRFDLSLPPLPKSETRAAVEHEVGKLAKIPEDELVIDYWAPRGKKQPAESSLQIKAFAAKRAAIQQHIDTLQVAGLKLKSIESRMLANIEALRFNDYIHSDSQCIVVDIGDLSTTIAFVRNGTLESCRSEETGMGTVNAVLQSRHGTDFLSAERAKIAYNLNSDNASQPDTDSIEEVYLRILRAIKESIDATMENTLDSKPERILLVGGGSRSI
ncbi:MAG: pilus assembly protein PilM, partial [Bdellovibrionales bacterium]|nr:pilus assembly protein PilM [Bdellovibrionales bacterium]